MDYEAISELAEDGAVFTADGAVEVKVTRGGVRKKLRLPITTAGVQDAYDALQRRAPRPPKVAVKAGSAEAAAFGLESDAWVLDTTDEAYIEALNEHSRRFPWRIAAAGLAVDFKRAGGGAVSDLDEKVAILRANGMTDFQIGEIYTAVMELTRWAEERADFLSAPPSDTPPRSKDS